LIRGLGPRTAPGAFSGKAPGQGDFGEPRGHSLGFGTRPGPSRGTSSCVVGAAVPAGGPALEHTQATEGGPFTPAFTRNFFRTGRPGGELGAASRWAARDLGRQGPGGPELAASSGRSGWQHGGGGDWAGPRSGRQRGWQDRQGTGRNLASNPPADNQQGTTARHQSSSVGPAGASGRLGEAIFFRGGAETKLADQPAGGGGGGAAPGIGNPQAGRRRKKLGRQPEGLGAGDPGPERTPHRLRLPGGR